MKVRTPEVGRNNSKSIFVSNIRFRSPRGTRFSAKEVTVVRFGSRRGSVIVQQGKRTERWWSCGQVA